MSYNDATECFAQPERLSMVDILRPGTDVSYHYGETLEQIRLRYPGAQRMLIDDFIKAKAAAQDAPVVWMETTAQEYDDMLNCLPPAFMGTGCFLVGEPMDHHAATGRPRYSAYVQRFGAFYTSSRPVQLLEFQTLITQPIP